MTAGKWRLLLGLAIMMVAMSLGCEKGRTTAPVVNQGAVDEKEVSMSEVEGNGAWSISFPGPEATSFAESVVREVEVVPRVLDYSTDLDDLANPHDIRGLSEEQRELLEQNGFVVVPSREAEMYSIYKRAKEQGAPILVTVDVMLHSLHVLYDFAFRAVEIRYLADDLQKLSSAMMETSAEQYRTAGGDVKEAAARNAGFFAVGSKLLDPEAEVPEMVREPVEEEIFLIEGHAGFSRSPLFGYDEDYSQYVPRGHYTRNEIFRRYFKAMMWYGRMSFRLRPGDTEGAIRTGRSETRSAILMVAALSSAEVDGESTSTIWDRIYTPTAFFVGRTDDLNVYDYAALIKKYYGETRRSSELEEDAVLDDFIAGAMALRPPRIFSSYVTDQEDPEEVTKGFRFMSQRYVPDSYILQQMVYDKVGTQQEPRLFPMGLDVMAVLGSDRAYWILDETLGETRYAHYDAQLIRLRREFAELPQEQRTENLYWGWLHCLRPLLSSKGEGYPMFMWGQAWADKELNAALGSWAELRHDTILYAKQSYTLRATAIQPQKPEASGYVEPQPEAYARLASLVGQMREGLDSRGLLLDELGDKMERMEALAVALQDISQRELKAEPLSEDDQRLIRDIGHSLESIVSMSPSIIGEMASEADTHMALVADVHTDTNTGQVLEEGVGDAFVIYAVVPVEAGTAAAQGAAFSYYEFLWPMEDRLTDEAWQAMSPRPDLPVWTDTFIR
jgi:hypothetical protein